MLIVVALTVQTRYRCHYTRFMDILCITKNWHLGY